MDSDSCKWLPKKKIYRSYITFDIEIFNDTLRVKLDDIKDNITYITSRSLISPRKKTFLEVLNK